jgi:hypothetical protein
MQSRVVVDFKTAAAALSQEQAKTDPQLGAYQLSLDSNLVQGAGRSEGAKLVYLGGSRSFVERTQPALTKSQDPDWMLKLLQQCVDRTAEASFEATASQECARCEVASSCPAVSAGEQVTA